MKTNTTLHLTPPPKKTFRSPRAASFKAPAWQHVPDESCPACGAELESNGYTIQCMNRGACDYAYSVTHGRRLD